MREEGMEQEVTFASDSQSDGSPSGPHPRGSSTLRISLAGPWQGACLPACLLGQGTWCYYGQATL